MDCNVEIEFGGMNERDRSLVDIMQKEMDAQRAGLRTIDNSIYTLAFAYIASLSLCVPALLTANESADQIKEMFPLVGTILCTIVFIGGFYALMLIRSRNVHMAHIAFLSDRINELVVRNYGEDHKVLFQQTREISEFYYGNAGGKAWFTLYGVFFLFLILFCFGVLRAGYLQGFHIGWIVLAEMVVMVLMYYLMLKKGGIRSVRQRIDSDYEQWLNDIDGRSSKCKMRDVEESEEGLIA